MADHKNVNTKKRKTTIVIISILAVVVIAAAVWAFLYFRQWVVPRGDVFIVDGKSYSKQEVEKLTTYPVSQGTSKEAAAKELYENLRHKKTAENLGLEISKGDLNKVKRDLYPEAIDSTDPWLNLMVYNAALDQQLEQFSDVGDVKGYAFIFRFGDHIEKGPGYTPEGYNDKNLIAQDKKYAKNQAEKYYKQLEAGKINPQRALIEIQRNPRLGYGGVRDSNPSLYFNGGVEEDTDQRGDGTVVFNAIPQDIINYLTSSEAKKGLNPIQQGKTLADANIADPKAKDYKPTYYFFTYVDRLNTKVTKKSFEDKLKSLPAKYVGLNN